MKKRLMSAVAMAAMLVAGSAWAQIKIGFHAPQSGPAAADGKSSTIGAEIARDWINEKGGVLGQKIELVIYDDQNKPDQAVPIANKLIGQDKVVATVSGSYSAPTRAAAAVFQTAGIPVLLGLRRASRHHLGRQLRLPRRHARTAAGQGRGQVHRRQVRPRRRSAMLTMNNDFGQSIADGFKEEAPKRGLTPDQGIHVRPRRAAVRPDHRLGQERQSRRDLRHRLLLRRRSAGRAAPRRRPQAADRGGPGLRFDEADGDRQGRRRGHLRGRRHGSPAQAPRRTCSRS